MTEPRAPEDNQIRRPLNRLRWALRAAVIVSVSLLELYYALLASVPSYQILLHMLLSYAVSVLFIEVCFAIIFRLHDQAFADRQQLAGMITENALLLQQTQQKLDEAVMLVEASHAMSSKLSQEELVPCLAENLTHILEGTGCFIVLRDPDTAELQLAAAYGHYAAQDPSPQMTKGYWYPSLVHAVIEAGQPIQDTSENPHIVPEEERHPADRSLLGLPLMVQGQATGAAIIAETREQRSFAEGKIGQAMVVTNQGAVAIANATLYAMEQREREVARTLLQIAGDLSSTLHLGEVLDLILERLRAVVPYESAAIGLLSGDVYRLAAAHHLPRAEKLWGTGLSPDDLPLVARVVNGRAAVTVEDTHQSDEWVITQGNDRIRSWLGVPLLVKDRTIGLLMLNHTSTGFYDQRAARLALAFAQHAAVVIDNARLYEQSQAKLHEQTLLYEMTAAVSSVLDAGRMLRFLAERLVEVLGVTSTRIATLAGETQTATVVAQHCSASAHGAEETSSTGQVYDLTHFPVTSEALLNRQPLLAVTGEEPDEWRKTMAQRSGQTMLLLPLVARDRVTGFVELWDSHSQRRFTETGITLAQTLINQTAVAVDNARLFAETRRRLSELTLLYDMAVAAASTRDLDAVLKSVVKTLQFRVLEGTVVSVLLLDEGKKQLRLRARAGDLEGVTCQESIPANEGIYGQVVRDGQPILINDTHQAPDHVGCGPNVRSILCVPLGWGQRVIGVLNVLSAQENAFSSHDRRLLRTMSSSLGIAIENVRLFNELELSEEALMLRNQALERANDRLQELDRLKSAFIATVSHELRTPLNAIIGFSEVLTDGLAGELTPLAQEYLGYIHDSGKHLLNLINDILDLSKIQAGRMTLQLEPVDVVATAKEVQSTLALLIAKKDQTFSIQQQDPLPPIVADHFRLKQILLNLVGNANKFTPEGGDISVRVLLIDPATLQLDVVDNGPGISLEDQSLIFEEFRQARSGQSPGQGTGLGLAITRRLVELHGGHIWVESELGAGSTFTILLPVAGPESETGEEQHDVAD